MWGVVHSGVAAEIPTAECQSERALGSGDFRCCLQSDCRFDESKNLRTLGEAFGGGVYLLTTFGLCEHDTFETWEAGQCGEVLFPERCGGIVDAYPGAGMSAQEGDDVFSGARLVRRGDRVLDVEDHGISRAVERGGEGVRFGRGDE